MSKDYARNQHFVPKAYLRFFAHKKKEEYYINVFDKLIPKDFKTNIDNIASHNYFYEVSSTSKNYWENNFNSIESSLPIVFNNLIVASKILPNKNKIINNYIKNNLCNIIHTQLLRTRSARLYFDKLGEDITYNMISDIEILLEEFLTPEHTDILNKYKKNLDFIHSVELDKFNDKKFIKKCQIYLKEKTWVLYKNMISKKSPFITSDNPIIFYNYLSGEKGFGYNGIARRETIIIYPLTKELLLVLYPNHLLLNGIKYISDKLIFLNDELFIKKINNLQYTQCYRQIYY